MGTRNHQWMRGSELGCSFVMLRKWLKDPTKVSYRGEDTSKLLKILHLLNFEQVSKKILRRSNINRLYGQKGACSF